VFSLKMRIKVAAVVVVTLAAAILGFICSTGLLIPTSWTASWYPVHGVDVSHHQGAIDWAKIPSDKIGFAYIKATEGGDYQDDRFVRNWKGAAKHGIARGAYHFFALGMPASVQAQNFIRTVPVETAALPPAVDLEFVENDRPRPDVPTFRAHLTEFLSRVRRKYKKEPVIYTTHDFYSHYLSGYPVQRLWIRSTWCKPRVPVTGSWTFWQFTDRQRVRGIHTLVDVNAFAGSKSDFDALAVELRGAGAGRGE